MIEEASCQKIKERVQELLEKYEVSEETSYSTQEKNNIYQCIIKYKKTENGITLEHQQV